MHGTHSPDPLATLASVPAVRDAARALITAVAEQTRRQVLDATHYEATLREISTVRGRPLFLPALLGGTGSGARVRLADGRELLDFIGGIGVYGMGHADPDLLEAAVVAAAGDVVFQGHLAPGSEYLRLSKALLRHAGPHLSHVWLGTCGAIANENALKMIWQHHAPADRIVVFDHAFAGRTTTLAELTDKPAYRDGLPLRGNVLHVPFFDPRDPSSTARSLTALDAHLARFPGRIAAMLFELVQGEGGIRPAPREFFATLMQRCRDARLSVWVDEVQTFARTGELFAFRRLGLEEWVDIATAGKILQGSAVLFRASLAPREGLVAGTYAGATVGMAVGTRIIERLESEGFFGENGRIVRLGRDIASRIDALRARMPDAVGDSDGTGAMHAFVPFDGSAAAVQAVIRAAFAEGVFVFSAGASPARVRLLPPVNVTPDELDEGFAALGRALGRVAQARALPC